MSSYNIVGLISEVSEEVATQIAKYCCRRQPHSHLRPPSRGTPTSRCHVCAVGSKRCIFSASECLLAVQGRSGSSKFDDFGTNRKRVCDFLLVGHCNYGSILHRFWDTAIYWLKLPIFLPLSHSAPSLPIFFLEFCDEFNHEETRVMGLSYREDRMILAWIVLTQCQRVTDGQTERRTDLLYLEQRLG